MQKQFYWCLLIVGFWLGALTDVVAQQRKPPAFEHVHALAIDASVQSLFLGAHAGLFRSDDGGRLWKEVPVSAKHAHLDVMDVAPDPGDPKTIYIGTHEAGCSIPATAA